jgi:NAD(P)-dependent dehydrogenase (short-subunit alcohol dehydrogenase family)
MDPRHYTPEPAALQGRVIVVTGAGQGIGRAVALACGGFGATVVLVGRTQSRLESAYDELVARGAPEPAIAVMDFRRAGGPEYTALAEELGTTYGRIDGLLHNAGILGQRAPIEHYDVAVWHEVLHINLNVPFALTRTLLPLLRASTDASIVFAASGVGRKGRAYWGAYSVSKFGIEGLAQVLADEHSQGGKLRVNCLNPGGTRTAMRSLAYPGEEPTAVPPPESIVNPFVYLLGPASRGITGQSFDCQWPRGSTGAGSSPGSTAGSGRP